MTYADWLKRLVLLLIISGSAGAEQVRCALIVDRNEELRSSALVSLLEARLSQESHVQLLERDRIETILREQQISLAASAEPNAVVKAGRLLRADAFILLSVEKSTSESPSNSPAESLAPLLRVRVVETAHGLRLWDRYEELDTSNVQATVDRIADRVRIVAQKIGQPAGQVIPVGIVDIHRVQLPERYERLARVLPGLLSARLSAEPRILMLERESLGALLKEKQLTDGNEAAFWNSAVLIDGNIEPDPNGGIHIGLCLRRSDGTESRSFVGRVDPNAPASAVDKAGGEIARAVLGASLSASWPVAKEAGEFYRQGQFLKAHGRSEGAHAAFETAHALEPDNVHYTGALFVNEWRRRPLPGRRSNVTTYSDQDFADLVSVLVRQIERDSERGVLSAGTVQEQWAMMIGDGLRGSGYLATSVSVATEQIRQMNRDNRRIWVRALGRALDEQPVRGDDPFRDVRLRANLAWISSDEPNELMANIRASLGRVLLSPEMGGFIRSSEDRINLFRPVVVSPIEFICKTRFRGTHLEGADEAFAGLLQDYLRGLSEVNDPLLSLKCYAVLTRPDWNPADLERTAERERYVQKAMKMYEELTAPDCPLSSSMKQRVCQAARDVLSPGWFVEGDQAELVGKFENILNTAIQRKAVDVLAWWNPGYGTVGMPLAMWHPDLVKRYFTLLERVAAALHVEQGKPHVASAVRNIREWQFNARATFPKLDLKAEQPALRATILLDAEDWPNRWGSNLSVEQWWVLSDGCLWLVRGDLCMNTRASDGTVVSSSMMRVAGVSLLQKRVIAQWQGQVILPHAGMPSGLVACQGSLYFSWRGGGIVEFPKRLLMDVHGAVKPKVLTHEQGLPSEFITCMVSQSGRLWMAFGGGDMDNGLGVYDPKSQHCEVIFCGTRKGKNPFDAMAYTLTALRFVGPSDLLFHVSFQGGSEESRALSGVWRMHVESHEVERTSLSSYDLGREGCLWRWPSATGAVAGSNAVLQPVTVMQGELTIEQLSQLIQGVVPSPAPQQEIFTFQYSHLPGRYDSGKLGLPTAAIHEGYLWTCMGTTEIAIIQQGRSFEEARTIPNDILNGKPAVKFLSTPYGLVAIGSGTVGLIDAGDERLADPRESIDKSHSQP